MREWGRDWFWRRKGRGAPEPDADWKRQALDDSRQWLDAAGEEAPGHAEPEEADPDLRGLFAELVARSGDAGRVRGSSCRISPGFASRRITSPPCPARPGISRAN